MKVNCSVIIITKNEAQNIEACLRSVSFCDDVIVVDAESSDATVTIAKTHTQKVFIKRWEGFAAANIAEGFAGLRKRVWRTRGFGDFWQHMLVAEGSAEVAIDPFGLKEYDLIAPSLIVREAGGTFTDLAGEASVTSGSGVSSNGLLHNEYLVALASVSR